MKLEADWDDFAYDDGTPVSGEVIHIEISRDQGTSWDEIAVAAPDAATVQFDVPLVYGVEVLFRAVGEVNKEFGPYTTPISYTEPFPSVPMVKNLRIKKA
jgi:hypothetical protein